MLFAVVLASSLVAALPGGAGAQSAAPAVQRIVFLGLEAGDSTYFRGEAVKVRVVFDKRVAVGTANGAPYLELAVGTATRRASFVRSKRNALDFSYTVQRADVDSDGVGVPAGALTLNGATIKAETDAATDANVAHGAVAGGLGRKVDGSKVRPPEVQRVLFTGPVAEDSTHYRGETIGVRVLFKEDVVVETAGGRPRVALAVGSRTRHAAMTQWRRNRIDFSYTVQTGDADADGVEIAANALGLNGGTVKSALDSATSAVLAHERVAGGLARKVDGSKVRPPEVQRVLFTGPVAEDSTHYRGETIGVRVLFKEDVVVETAGGRPRVALAVGSRTRHAAMTQWRRNRIDFSYTVQTGDADADGVEIAANALGLNGGTVKSALDSATSAVLAHGRVAGGLARKVDGSKVRPPKASGVAFDNSPAGGDTYGYGERIVVRVAFDRAVVVSTAGGTPRLALKIGAVVRHAALSDTAGTYTRLLFSYAVQGSDAAPRGASIGANALELNGGSVKAGADGATDAVLAHGAVAADAARKVDGRRGRPPKVDGVSFAGSAPGDSTYRHGDSIVVRVGFDESVAVDVANGKPQVALAVGTVVRQAVFSAHSGKTVEFVYVVQSADRDLDGASVGANALALNGGVITGAADGAVAADVTHDAVAADATRKVDGRPRIVSLEFVDTHGAIQGLYKFEERIWIWARFDQKLDVGGRVSMALEVGTDTVQATSSLRLRSGDSAVAFFYRVKREDRDADGVSVPKGALVLNGSILKAASDDATDANLEHGGLAADSSRRVDGSLIPTPRLRVVVRNSPAKGATFTWKERIHVEASFQVGVIITGNPRLTLNVGTKTRQLAASVVDPRSFEYVVQAGDVDADGISIPANALSLPNGATIRSAANTSIHATLSHDSVPADPQRKVDGRLVEAPRALRMGIEPPPSRGDTFTRGEMFYIKMFFDRDVAVDTTHGRPRIALSIGDSTRYATYRQPSRGRPWIQIFGYVVQAGDRDADGISVAANALSANGGSITLPGDTTPAALSHVPMPAGWKVDGSRTAPPSVRWVWFNAPLSEGTYLRGERIHVTAEFDRRTSVDTAGGTPRMAIRVGNSTRHATYAGGPGAYRYLNFHYVVQAGDRDADGVSIAANALSANGGSITAPGDTAAADLSHGPVAADGAHRVDGRRSGTAKIQSIAVIPHPSRDSTYTRDELIYVYVSFDRDVAVATTGGRPRIALAIGDSTRYATYSHLFGRYPSSQHVFHYAVQAGDQDADGISIAANALSANGGSVTAPDDTVAADLSHGPLAADSAYKVNGSRIGAPRVQAMWSLPPASGNTYVRGERIRMRVSFDRRTSADTVGGRPRLAIRIGDSTRYATGWNMPATGIVFDFVYVVQRTDVDTDGISVGANALSANGGSITLPGSTMPAVLAHDSMPADLSRRVDGRRTSIRAGRNHAPTVVAPIPARVVEVASDPAAEELSAYFRDPDGDPLAYSAVSAAQRVADVEIAGSVLTIRPLAVGRSVVTVGAADPGGGEAEQSFLVTVEASRSDRARILKRSLAAFGRAVGTETVEAIGGRLETADEPGAMGGPDVQVGGRSLACVGASGSRGCGLQELARQAAGLVGLRVSQGAGSLASLLHAVAEGGHDAGAVRGLVGAFGRPADAGAVNGLETPHGFGAVGGSAAPGGFGAVDGRGVAHGVAAAGGRGDSRRWGRLVSIDPLSRRRALARSSFRFSPGAADRAVPGGWTFWGQANAGGFKGRPDDDLALDGTVRSAYLGADYRFGRGPLVGLALSRATSSIGFESGVAGAGAVDARLTGLYPYVQWSPRKGLSAWGLLGAGRGTASMSEDATGRRFETRMRMLMTAAGARRRLVGVLAFKADAFVVRTDAGELPDLPGVAATVHRLRLAPEIGGRWAVSERSSISSEVELGARFDGGDAETGAGAEAGARLAYAHEGAGLSVDVRGRALVAHQAAGFEDWGASVSVRLRPGRDEGGLSFALEPAWGNAASGAAALWRDGTISGALGASLGRAPAGDAMEAAIPDWKASRINMETAYAIVLPDGGRVAPFGRLAVENGSGRRINVGIRLSTLGASADAAHKVRATIDLFGEHVSRGAEPADRRLGVQGAVRLR